MKLKVKYFKLVAKEERNGLDVYRIPLTETDVQGIEIHLKNRYAISDDILEVGDKIWYVKRMLLSDKELEVELIEVRKDK
jgi:hypothetical protein